MKPYSEVRPNPHAPWFYLAVTALLATITVWEFAEVGPARWWCLFVSVCSGLMTVAGFVNAKSGYTRVYADRIVQKSLGFIHELRRDEINGVERDKKYRTLTIQHISDSSRNMIITEEDMADPAVRAFVKTLPEFVHRPWR